MLHVSVRSSTFAPTATRAVLPPQRPFAPQRGPRLAPRLGNQAVLRALSQRGDPAPRSGAKPSLQLSMPGDPAEREADQVADQVMRMSSTQAGPGASATTSATLPSVQRACESCEKEELQRDTDEPEGLTKLGPGDDMNDDDEDFDEDDDSGWPKLEAGAPAPPGRVARDIVPRGAGRPLEAPVERFMGERFGRDFSAVRIHTDSAAAGSARQLNARAYTVGSNIYFNEGRYSPNAPDGQRLLAHELTHVAQQDHAPERLQRQDDAGSDDKKPTTLADGGTEEVPVDTGDAEEQTSGKHKASSACNQAGCRQGHAKAEVAGDCNSGGPPDNQQEFIKHLEVSVGAGTVVATWSGGGTDQWSCTGNVNGKKGGKKYGMPTPRGDDKIGVKCGVHHTNQITKKRKVPDNMGWFTGLAKWGRRVGFHDSQPVGGGYVSHACIRVCCNHAEIINKNTWSGKTTVHVK